jgi:hypothetical protein
MLKCFSGGVWRRLALLAVGAAGCSQPAQVSSPVPGAAPARQSTAITDGESLVRAMYERYQNKWYRTMTFVQATTITRGSNPPQVQTWYEALLLPGRLRIDFNNPEAGNGALFRGDSTYNFSGGRLANADTGFNPLLVLGFDVYNQPPEQTISILRHLGYQLSRLHTASLDGRSAYVVGASTNSDSTSKQFWIERDRLLFVRSRERTSAGQQSDVRFTDYAPAGNGWIARQVWQFMDGNPRLHEQYANIKADVPLDSALFDPKQWSTVKHWTKP